MNVVCCQLDIAWEDKRANFDKVSAMLSAQPPERDDLILLPEMFATGFSMNVPAIAESDPHPTEDFLAATAARLGVYLAAGLVRKSPAGLGRNELVGYSPDGRKIARYQKIHPFSHGGEPAHYEAGADIITFPWRDFVVCPFICYDLRFPEIFRSAVRRGATLFAVIANWPAAREHHWITLLQARAIENQAYVAGVNRCGKDPNVAYSGRSLIIDPRGAIIADAADRETCISAELDPRALQAYRAEFAVLADMRPDTT